MREVLRGTESGAAWEAERQAGGGRLRLSSALSVRSLGSWRPLSPQKCDFPKLSISQAESPCSVVGWKDFTIPPNFTLRFKDGPKKKKENLSIKFRALLDRSTATVLKWMFSHNKRLLSRDRKCTHRNMQKGTAAAQEWLLCHRISSLKTVYSLHTQKSRILEGWFW